MTKMKTNLRLNYSEGDSFARAVSLLRDTCKSLKDRGAILSAAALAKQGRTMAHLIYTKGQVGYNMFDKFLSD